MMACCMAMAPVCGPPRMMRRRDTPSPNIIKAKSMGLPKFFSKTKNNAFVSPKLQNQSVQMMCDEELFCDDQSLELMEPPMSIDALVQDNLPQPSRDPLLQLVSLQKASGCWVRDPALAAALGKTSEEVENTKPSAVNQEVWATILALIWLHGFKMDTREEWELLAMKAVSWLRAQNAPCLTECVDAGNALLGCSVQKDVLGL